MSWCSIYIIEYTHDRPVNKKDSLLTACSIMHQMLSHIRHTAVLILGLVLVAVIACGGTEPELNA